MKNFDNFNITSDSIIDPLTNKEQCKKDGWKTFTDPTFKNQGQCVSYVEHLNKDDADDNDNDRNHVDSDDEGHDKHEHEDEEKINVPGSRWGTWDRSYRATETMCRMIEARGITPMDRAA